MGQPAAKKGDRIVGTDMHAVLVTTPSGPIPQNLPHPFSGIIDNKLSPDVSIMGQPAAVVGSTGRNIPAHVPTPPGTGFQQPPANQAAVERGSATVRINGKPAARSGDTASTCTENDMLPPATVVAAPGTVMIG